MITTKGLQERKTNTEWDNSEKKVWWKCRDNDERPTGKKNSTTEWEDSKKKEVNSNLILTDFCVKQKLLQFFSVTERRNNNFKALVL